MTRDEVLESAAQRAEADLGEVQPCDDAPVGLVEARMRGDAGSSERTARRIAAGIRSLKSKPPEKSPEVECGRCVAAEEKWHELAALRTADALEFGRVVAERDALRAEVARLKREAAGSPMQGEHAGDPADCAACADGYPPPPGEPAPR